MPLPAGFRHPASRPTGGLPAIALILASCQSKPDESVLLGPVQPVHCVTVGGAVAHAASALTTSDGPPPPSSRRPASPNGELVTVEMATVTDSGIDLIIRHADGRLRDRSVTSPPACRCPRARERRRRHFPLCAGWTVGPVDAVHKPSPPLGRSGDASAAPVRSPGRGRVRPHASAAAVAVSASRRTWHGQNDHDRHVSSGGPPTQPHPGASRPCRSRPSRAEMAGGARGLLRNPREPSHT